MKVAVIGPTDISVTQRAAGLDPVHCEEAASQAGKLLAELGHQLIVVPDRGVGLLAARAYADAGGPRLTGIMPRGGTTKQAQTSCCEHHRSLCHEVIEDLAWTEQHQRICELSDALLCLGISCGTISEIAWTKWVGKPPVIVVRPLVSGIPPEIAAETDVRWAESLAEAVRSLPGVRKGEEHG